VRPEDRPSGLREAVTRLWPADFCAAPGMSVALSPTLATDPAAPGATDDDVSEMALHAEGSAADLLVPATEDTAHAHLIVALLSLDAPEGRTFLHLPDLSVHGRALAATLPPRLTAALKGWALHGLPLWRSQGRILLLGQALRTQRWRLLGVR
jgi:hypothetical protein